jgi:TetR/AcrR family transcriptional regulator, regulator of autoinduction and epiphytic fitness
MAARKRDTSKKHKSILDAAARVFQDEGYENASMDRIAEVAAASKRTVYNHFPSKEALFQEVVERLMAEASALKMIRYDSSLSLEEQLSEFAEAKLAMVKNPSWLGLMRVAITVAIRDPELAKKATARAEAGENTLVTWLKAATEDGKLMVENHELAAGVFWSLIGGSLFWPQLIKGPMDPMSIQVLKEELIKTFLCRYGA